MQGSPATPAPFVGSGRNGLLTEADARALLEEHAQSGQTLKSFAESKGLNGQRLGWWKKKFTREQAAKTRQRRVEAKPSARKPRFVSVVAAREVVPSGPLGAPSARGGYEVLLGDAMTLRVPDDFQDQTLARILRVLRVAR
jgi:hypothetical protein